MFHKLDTCQQIEEKNCKLKGHIYYFKNSRLETRESLVITKERK